MIELEIAAAAAVTIVAAAFLIGAQLRGRSAAPEQRTFSQELAASLPPLPERPLPAPPEPPQRPEGYVPIARRHRRRRAAFYE